MIWKSSKIISLTEMHKLKSGECLCDSIDANRRKSSGVCSHIPQILQNSKYCFPRACLKIDEMSNGERFFRQSRRFDAAILCVWQGKSTQSGGKRSAVWAF